MLSGFRDVALFLGVKPDTVRLIEKQLDACWQDNKGLLGEWTDTKSWLYRKAYQDRTVLP